MPKRVFISHSHQDRHAATHLQGVLEKYRAETFLDQDRILAGDVLTDRIRAGIEWCDTFLLLWSSGAVASNWVQQEWNLAWDLRKKIIPYLLSSAPLPPALENLVFVDAEDQNLGHAGLLRAVFGQGLKINIPTPFPGWWHAEVDAFGMGKGLYRLELRDNGQVEGEGGIEMGGFAGGLLNQFGLGNLRIQVYGRWRYMEDTQTLILEMTASGFGQQSSDTVHIQTTGYEHGAIQGTDLVGRSWVLQRLNK